jgi:hypothetical protein
MATGEKKGNLMILGDIGEDKGKYLFKASVSHLQIIAEFLVKINHFIALLLLYRLCEFSQKNQQKSGNVISIKTSAEAKGPYYHLNA